ncbi:hypothetical protein B0H15DRAFT_944629 [Mycena belliarum]|uniref:Uncharacterized protein n=1 Tax=Mycena belliarum TaxID=1033014 RepID=A0AAD6UEF1_9AGAR|nr:hypothetical protein B0H15DRAFT_944629 [Mycena belliae]
MRLTRDGYEPPSSRPLAPSHIPKTTRLGVALAPACRNGIPDGLSALCPLPSSRVHAAYDSRTRASPAAAARALVADIERVGRPRRWTLPLQVRTNAILCGSARGFSQRACPDSEAAIKIPTRPLQRRTARRPSRSLAARRALPPLRKPESGPTRASTSRAAAVPNASLAHQVP